MAKKRTIVVLLLPVALIAVPAGASASSGTGTSLSSVPSCGGVTAGTVHPVTIGATTVTSVEPPAGFDPLTASPAQLACYGYPTRPAGGLALSAWTNAMQRARHYVVPAFGPPLAGATQPLAGTKTYKPYPWSGYTIPASKNGQWSGLKWHESTSTWFVPYGHTYCTGSEVEVWTGLGGDGWDGGNYNALIQGGSDTFNESPKPTAEFWWENYNYNNPVPITSLAVSPGDGVLVNVNYTGNGYTTFYYENVSTGYNTTWGDRHTPNVDQSSADFIVENQATGSDFVNFGSIPGISTFADGTWGSGYDVQKTVNQANISEFDSYNSSGQEVSYPGTPSNGSFTDYTNSNAHC